jgi:serine/threonine protein kinase
VEELAVGGSLFSRLHETHGPVCPLPLREALRVLLDVAEALAYLHPSVVHRDLKSHNVLLDGEGRAKVCDVSAIEWCMRRECWRPCRPDGSTRRRLSNPFLFSSHSSSFLSF